jgi:hypothetical protein
MCRMFIKSRPTGAIHGEAANTFGDELRTGQYPAKGMGPAVLLLAAKAATFVLGNAALCFTANLSANDRCGSISVAFAMSALCPFTLPRADQKLTSRDFGFGPIADILQYELGEPFDARTR